MSTCSACERFAADALLANGAVQLVVAFKLTQRACALAGGHQFRSGAIKQMGLMAEPVHILRSKR
ncbi:hypothetical protein D3C77_647720 [compost metagenome]